VSKSSYFLYTFSCNVKKCINRCGLVALGMAGKMLQKLKPTITVIPPEKMLNAAIKLGVSKMGEIFSGKIFSRMNSISRQVAFLKFSKHYIIERCNFYIGLTATFTFEPLFKISMITRRLMGHCRFRITCLKNHVLYIVVGTKIAKSGLN